ncbi:hypothetical protein KSP39_PZI022266 [Platanthera zijinensis]|uniref:Uncharacterized protein n=1 Tax=Platanthera zijinensis TaxID=2320716 RepID=A0AAP0FV13_9ASPA
MVADFERGGGRLGLVGCYGGRVTERKGGGRLVRVEKRGSTRLWKLWLGFAKGVGDGGFARGKWWWWSGSKGGKGEMEGEEMAVGQHKRKRMGEEGFQPKRKKEERILQEED